MREIEQKLDLKMVRASKMTGAITDARVYEICTSICNDRDKLLGTMMAERDKYF